MDGEQVIATGTHHSMFFVYDMMAGSIIPIPKVRGMFCSSQCLGTVEAVPNKDGTWICFKRKCSELEVVFLTYL